MKKVTLALLAAIFVAPSIVKADEAMKPAETTPAAVKPVSTTSTPAPKKEMKKHSKKEHKAASTPATAK